LIFEDPVTSWLVDEFDTVEYDYPDSFPLTGTRHPSQTATVYPMILDLLPGRPTGVLRRGS
jgi:hypothetical protein